MMWSIEWPAFPGALSDVFLILGIGLIGYFALKPGTTAIVPVLGWISIVLTLLIRIGMIVTAMSLTSALNEALIAINRVLVFTLAPALTITAVGLCRALLGTGTQSVSSRIVGAVIGVVLITGCALMLLVFWGRTTYSLGGHFP